MKRLGVIGTLVWDHIWYREAGAARNQPVEEWGGIAYSLAALAAHRPGDWEIVPILKVGRDLAGAAGEFLRTIPGLDLGPAIQIVPQPNNRVELRYSDEARRCERLTGGVPPWRWSELAPLMENLDALYINFISGYEMELPDLQQLRAHYAGPVYADLHSLLLGRTPAGHRVPQPLGAWREWLRCLDAVQLNEDELATLAGSWGDPWRFAADVLRHETNLLVVTLGAAGAAYFAEGETAARPAEWTRRRVQPLHRAEAVRTGRIPAPTAPAGADPTGCGDVWGSTFFLSLLAGFGLEEAIHRAHSAAVRNLGHYGASGLYSHLKGALHIPAPT